MKTAKLNDYDLYLFHHGTNYHAHEMFGAHFVERDGKKGVRFALWAPQAKAVSVVGNFPSHAMTRLDDGETWEIFVEGLSVGDTYQYAVLPQNGETIQLQDDPYGFCASKLYDLEGYNWTDDEWQKRKNRQISYTHPMLIYEVDAGSWRNGLSWRELTEQLIPYAAEMNYTHIEFMSLTEQPFALTVKHGEPNDFRHFVETAHENNIGVIMDWNCAGDVDYGRAEMQSNLLTNALFWLEQFHIDGLRIDGVANMLYLNCDAVEFLKRLNETVFKHHPQALMMVREAANATPAHMGFNYKWNAGWLSDVLDYVSLDPVYRKWNHDRITFSFRDAFAENFILPLSHEVVSGTRSLIEKMPGDYWQKFAGLRCFFGYWMAHPGKKLLFMGGEFGQFSEWNAGGELDWFLVDQYEKHAQMKNYSRALNKFYRENKALWQLDFERAGFQWIDCNDNDNSVITFLRKAENGDDYLIALCNFTPEVRHGYRIGVPNRGEYVEVFNSDAEEFGGSGVTNSDKILAEDIPWHDRNHSIALTVPPLAVIFLARGC